MTKEDFIAGKPFTVNGLPYSHLEYNCLTDSLICFTEQRISHRTTIIQSKRDLAFTALLPVFGVVQCVTIDLECCDAN